MIVDRAADLKLLVAQAATSAKVSTETAALAAIEEQVARADARVQRYAIGTPAWLEQLDEPNRLAVSVAAGRLVASAQRLADATDAELSAYASGGQEGRGALTAVLRDSIALAQTLEVAQNALLERWAESIWPSDDLVRLDILAHVPASAGVAREAEATREQLLARVGQSSAVSAVDLEMLDGGAQAVCRLLSALPNSDIPDEVIVFWRAAAQPGGASLSTLTDAVAAWLDRHKAHASFIVSRAP